MAFMIFIHILQKSLFLSSPFHVITFQLMHPKITLIHRKGIHFLILYIFVTVRLISEGDVLFASGQAAIRPVVSPIVTVLFAYTHRSYQLYSYRFECFAIDYSIQMYHKCFTNKRAPLCSRTLKKIRCTSTK